VIVDLSEESVHDEDSGIEVSKRDFSHNEVEQSKSSKELVNGQLSVIGVVGLEKDVFVEEFINGGASQGSQHFVDVSLKSVTGSKEDFLSFSVEDRREVFIIEIEGFQFDIGDHSVIIFSLIQSEHHRINGVYTISSSVSNQRRAGVSVIGIGEFYILRFKIMFRQSLKYYIP